MQSTSAENPEKIELWEDFACPRYIKRTCKKSDKLSAVFPAETDCQPDVDCIVRKLHELVSDSASNDNVSRICRLLYDYVEEIADTGYKMKHLPAVIKILRFLLSAVQNIKNYEMHFDRMLDLCRIPPILDKVSDTLNYFDDLEQYFTLMGDLLASLSTKQRFFKIHLALHSLLFAKDSTETAVAQSKYRIKAMENSRLSVTVAELLEASSPDLYPPVIELVFLLVSVSELTCRKMLEAGILNTLLVRIDLTYATLARCTPPPDVTLDGPEYPQETTLLITYILWGLMVSIYPSAKQEKYSAKELVPRRCAMWGLRYAIKRHFCRSQYSSLSVKIRNDLAHMILMGLIGSPSWNLVNSGIAHDIVLILVGIESGSVFVLSENIPIGYSNEDLRFYKILLLIVGRLADVEAFISIVIKQKLIKTILHLINPTAKNVKTQWKPCHYESLSEYAFQALAALASKAPKEFIKYKGTIRLSMMVERNCGSNFNVQIIMHCVRCIWKISSNSDSSLLEHIREDGIIISLLRVLHRILELNHSTMLHQRIIIMSLLTINVLMTKQIIFQELYENQFIALAMKLLSKCLYQEDTNFQLDPRLLLAIGAYIWKCIIPCPTSLQKFVEFGAVYVILDIIEIASYHARCLYLGILTDICDNYFCGVYLSTWRGVDKNKGLLSLLAMLWREEEIRIGVKNHADGSIDDVEFPQMGAKQWYETYRLNPTANISPAIIDTIGSVRSKIYSIRKIIERDSEKHEIASQRYKILYNEPSEEDQITLSCIDLYFRIKLGQVWIEVSRYLEKVKILPLSLDSQMLSTLIQRHHSWAVFIKEQQRKIKLAGKMVEEEKERDCYATLKNAMLSPALDALDQLDYIRRVSDKDYRLKKKSVQKSTVESLLHFPQECDHEHCFETYQREINVTEVFGQHYMTVDETALNSNFIENTLRPVSPCESSGFSPSISLSNLTTPSTSDNCLRANKKN